jgi:hypothetical protein
MTYELTVVSDSNRIYPAGKFAGQSAEKFYVADFLTLGEAIAEYEKYRDHGFALWERTVSILSESGELIATKTLKRPTE